MARKGRQDRGLLWKKDSAGKTVWHVRLYHEGKERRFGSFPSKTLAREFYEKAKLEQKEGRFFPERYHGRGYDSVEETIDNHIAVTQVKNLSAERNYGRWWKTCLRGKRLNGITPALLEAAQRSLFEIGHSPQTVVHYMKFLRHVLNKAVRNGKIERNPFCHITLLKVHTGKTRYLTLEEEAALLADLGCMYGPWARLAILTGLRLSEQFELRWIDVDLSQGVITLPKTKARRVQYVPLNEEAQAILRNQQIRQMNQNGCGLWVFPSENPATHMDQRNFYSRVFVPAVQACGLHGVTWHTLRHTFASRLAMSGHKEGTIASLLRHSSTALVQRYAHLSPSHLRTAVEAVSHFGKAPAAAPKPGSDPKASCSNSTVTETVTEDGVMKDVPGK